MGSMGVFEVATASEGEQSLRKQAMQDKIAAATYDVRERHGEWLFGATDLDAFNDRAKLAYVDICKTIEPHMHARTGVYKKVLKNLEREWRQRKADLSETSIGENIDNSIANSVPGAAKQPKMPRQHVKGPQLEGRRTACYPGCHEDEAHAKKFHKDEKSDEKEARRRTAGDYPSYAPKGNPSEWQAAPDSGRHHQEPLTKPTVSEDPERAHQILDRAHDLHHDNQVFDHAHDLVDQRSQAGPGLYQAPGPHVTPNPHSSSDPWGDSEHYGARYAEFEDQHDHPELHTHETYEPHTYETLEPEGDFESYKDRVDQGADSKVDRDFTPPDPDSSSPYKVQEHNDNGDHNFVPTVTGARMYSEYQRIARMLQADVPPAGVANGTAPGAAAGMSAGSMAPADPSGAGSGMDSGAQAPMTSSPPAGAAPPMQTMASREFQMIASMLHQGIDATPTPGVNPVGAPVAPATADSTVGQTPSLGGGSGVASGAQPIPAIPAGPMPTASKGASWASKMIREVGTKQARVRLVNAARRAKVISAGDHKAISAMYSFRYADRNYLQQADEALTKVLNEKAEEFQNTIAPLQQALITIQQAEQLTNPLNVSPPAGTVNVLPQQAGAAPGQAPQGDGGLGASPAAAGLAGQPSPQQQLARRKRGGSPKG